jgi:hypothetical protein
MCASSSETAQPGIYDVDAAAASLAFEDIGFESMVESIS